MNSQSLIFGIAGVFIGALIVWSAATSAVNNQNYGMMGMMGLGRGTGPNLKADNSGIDSHFIEQMIPHHEDAITMAKLAQTKAVRPEVKQLAQNIIDSQSKEIEQMKSWYKDWFGKDVPATVGIVMGKSSGMHGGMMGDASDTTKLETAGDFDKEFLEEMIPHHQMAVMMATMLKNGTQRPEMKQLAQDIIIAQTKEINQMRQWYKEWGYQ